jgi:two-component system chemotaxis response regulator CheB
MAINVLVVDDSALMRSMIADMLRSDKEISVVGTAKNGKEVIEKVKKCTPNVVTLDIQMPKMDGLTALEHIMNECPTPTVMLSALTTEGMDATIDALRHGAVDFVPKPSGPLSLNIGEVKSTLISKVKVASSVNLNKISRISRVKPSRVHPSAKKESKAIVIGASTGGSKALEQILPYLPGDIPAKIMVVQHMPPGFTHSFARRLDKISEITIKEGEKGDIIEDGHAFIAPGDHNMKITKNGRRYIIDLSQGWHGIRPSVDVTMQDVAASFKSQSVGVILTGMGNDGAIGMRAIHENGGKTIASDEDTSLIFGMPKAAIDGGCVDEVLPLDQIAKSIMEML